jgi:hypothetical protein
MRPARLYVGGVLKWTILTRNPDTGVLKDADSTPTVAVRKNGEPVGDSVTVTKRTATTGRYDCEYNPAGEVANDTFQFEESVTITGTTTAQATYDNQFSVSVEGAVELDSGALDPVLAAIEDIAAGGLTDAQATLLTQIGQRTAQIAGARLSVVGAVTPAGEISLIVGSDYVSAINSSLTRTITDAGAVLHAKLTAGALSQLVFRAAPEARSSLERKITGIISAVSHSAGVTSVTIVIDREDIPNGPYGDSWKYQIWREADSLVSPPLLEGALLLDWRV